MTGATLPFQCTILMAAPTSHNSPMRTTAPFSVLPAGRGDNCGEGQAGADSSSSASEHPTCRQPGYTHTKKIIPRRWSSTIPFFSFFSVSFSTITSNPLTVGRVADG